ncbi:MAG: prepilin-type N-terminal cleavage/methylation domain-containing protein [Smithellaceae bacterium]|nr:prepilin-type N-terminal cleavage/methylation domain-containing protein [Smithellaceae bacterium]
MRRNAAYGRFTKPSGFTLVELLVVIALVGIILVMAVPVTRDILTTSSLKKASRQLIGLERKLRVEAVRDQVDYILLLDIPGASYYVITPDMTPEKQNDVKKNAKKFPAGVAVLDIINQKNEKIAEGVVKIKFGKNNICPPLVIHLAEAEDEGRMTLVVNPFLGVTAVYDKYVDISLDDGLGKDAAK